MEEQVRRLYEQFTRGDLESLLALVTDDVEWLSPPGGVPGLEPSYHGRDGVRRWFADLREGWDYMETHAEHVERVAPEVAFLTVRMSGRAEGADTEMRLWHVVRFQGEKVAFLQPFFDREAARAVARHQAQRAQDLKTEPPG